jgi:hypothetical protein
MKRDVMRCLSGLMICAVLTGWVHAQSEEGGTARVSDGTGPLPETASSVTDPGVVYGQSSLPGGYFQTTTIDQLFQPRYFVDARGGVLYGYEESFTNVGAFLPYFFEEDALLFLDARGLVSYNGKGGANLGFGWRYYEESLDRIFGLHGFYDFDGGHRRSYNQVGLGIESLGRYFDFRMNGYIPVGNDQNLLSTGIVVNEQFPAQFVQNQLYVTRLNELETAFTGFDVEVGGPMPILGRYGLSGYVGTYFFTSSASATDFTGVSGRLSWQANEYTNIGVQATDDHVFGSNAQIQVSMTLPNGNPGRWLRPLSVRERLTQSVVRNYRVTVEHEIKAVQEAAINPKDNLPYFIAHIDPNAGTGGNGNVETPFQTLGQYNALALTDREAIDIIFVKTPVDDPLTILDETLARQQNLSQGITLLTGQRLLSNAVSHTFAMAQVPGPNNTYPQFLLPGYTQPTSEQNFVLPTLTRAGGGNVVTLADGAICVEVSGFTINGNAAGSGIVGTNNQNVLINRNVIQNGLNGINLTNLSGLASNTTLLNRESIFTSNIIRYNTVDGIRVDNSGTAALDLTIAHNPDFRVAGIGEEPTNDFVRDPAIPNVDQIRAGDLPNVAFNRPDSLDGDGEIYETETQLSPSTPIGSRPQVAYPAYVELASGDTAQDPRTQSNDLLLTTAIGERNPVTGEFVTPPGAARDDGILGNGDDGIDLRAQNGSVINLVLDSNRITNNGGTGVELTATAGSTIRGVMLDNIIGNVPGASVPTANPIVEVAAPVQLNGVTISTSGSTIDFFNQYANSRGQLVQAQIRGNTLGGHIDNGFAVNSTNGSTVSLGMFSNNVGSSIIPNIGAFDDNNDFIPARFAGNGEIGFLFNADSGTSLLAIGADDTVVPNGAAIRNGNRFEGNLISGIDVNLTGTAIGGLGIENNTVIGGSPTGVGLSFFISGNTFFEPYTVTNDSSSGAEITSFTFDISPAQRLFDTVEPQGSIPFQPLAAANNPTGPQSDITTGLTTVNGTAVTAGTNPLEDAAGTVLVDGGVPDNSQVIALNFNDFQDQEQLTFQIDIDPLTNTDFVFGSELIGSEITATFDNGSTLSGVMAAVQGDPLAATFVARQATGGSGSDGIHVSTSGLAVLNPSVIQNNLVQSSGRHGIHAEASGLSNISNLVVRDNLTQVNAENGLQLTRSGAAELNATVQNNVFRQNGQHGLGVLATGTVAPAMDLLFEDNLYTLNADDGLNISADGNATVNATLNREEFIDNGGDNIQVFTQENATVRLDLNEIISTGAGGNGLITFIGGNGNLLLNLTGQNNVFSENEGSGLLLGSLQNGQALVNIEGAEFNDNGVDGLSFSRLDASLIVANVTDSTMTGNQDDGIQFDTNGSPPTDPNQPLTPQPNLLRLRNVTANNNGTATADAGGNGLEVNTAGNSTLQLNVAASEFSDNSANGAQLFSTGSSSVGASATDRAVFDNVTLTGNNQDGLKLFAMGQFSTVPSQFVQVSSQTGQTLIAQNGDDGIQASVPLGSIDLLVTGRAGANFTTFIQENSGNGIEFNNADAALGTLLPAGNPDARFINLDEGDVAIMQSKFQNGWQFDSFNPFNATSVLTVRNVAIGDINRFDGAQNTGNLQNGIAVFNSNIDNFTTRYLTSDAATGPAFQLVGRAGNMTVDVDNSLVSGNRNDGLSLISNGHNSTFDVGNILNATVTNSELSDNGSVQTISSNQNGVPVTETRPVGNGVNINLEGRHGEYTFFGTNGVYERLSGNQFVFDNNVMERNAENGFRFVQNAGVQTRVNFDDGAFSSHWGIPFIDPQPTSPAFAFNPINVGASFAGAFFNFSNGLSGIPLSDYMNLATELNSSLVFNNNRVQFNGAPGQRNADGMYVRVSTNSYLSADVGGAAGSGNGNTYTGNSGADLRIESFVAYDQADATQTPILPPVSIARDNANGAFDVVFLDDTAQLDMRFNNNSGREVDSNVIFVLGGAGNAGRRTAAYDNVDVFKGSPGGQIRATQIFQLDDGLNVNVNNTWGVQNLINEFNGDGNFFLRTVADPNFPNPAFPEPFDIDPGDVFLP